MMSIVVLGLVFVGYFALAEGLYYIRFGSSLTMDIIRGKGD